MACSTSSLGSRYRGAEAILPLRVIDEDHWALDYRNKHYALTGELSRSEAGLTITLGESSIFLGESTIPLTPFTITLSGHQ